MNSEDGLNKRLKKSDIILILSLFLAGLLLLVCYFIGGGPAKSVVINVDGRTKARYDINTNRTVVVNGYDGGMNIVTIAGGEVYVSEADCPDKVCMNMGHIKHTNQSIVCMPHRVMVYIDGKAGEDTPDAYTGGN